MKYSTTTSILAESRTDCLIGSLSLCEKTAAQQGAGRFFRAAVSDFEDKSGQTLLVNLGTSSPIRRMLVVGGLQKAVDPAEFTKAARGAATRLKDTQAKSAVWALGSVRVTDRDPYWKATTAMSALSNTLYTCNAYKSSEQAPL